MSAGANLAAEVQVAEKDGSRCYTLQYFALDAELALEVRAHTDEYSIVLAA
jgi:hypothetical protein